MSLVSSEGLLIPTDIDSNIKPPQEEAMLREESRHFSNDIPVSKGTPDQSILPMTNKYGEDKINDNALLSDSLSQFNLGMNSELKGDLYKDYKLDLSKGITKTIDSFFEVNYENKKINLKTLRGNTFLFPYFNQLPGNLNSAWRGKGGTSQRRSDFVINKSDYLTQWAENVSQRIYENWKIPSPEKIKTKCIVGIYVIFEKNGEPSSVKINHSSLVQLLDDAALKAIELSSPFPKLPNDFQDERVEVFFEFHYYD